MTEAQRRAIQHPCLIASQAGNPILSHRRDTYRVVLSVNRGYE